MNNYIETIPDTKLKDLVCLCKCPEDECIYKAIYLLRDGTVEYGTKYSIKQKDFFGNLIHLCGKFEDEKKANPEMTLGQYLEKYQKLSDEVFKKEVEHKRDFNGYLSGKAKQELTSMYYERCKHEEVVKPRMEVISIELHEI